MQISEPWPLPDDVAIAHSERLIAAIRDAIDAQGGAIPFEQFMDMALYEPGLGYYAAGARKLGAAGDFITAPEVSPLFSRCLARQVAEVLKELGGGDLLELGAGSGVMAKDILLELDTMDCLPKQFMILEVSPDLRERQQQLLQQHLPDYFPCIRWIDRLPDDFRGVLLANEVLDAMPVTRFRYAQDSFDIAQVGFDKGFAWCWQAADDATARHLEALRLRQPGGWPQPYVSEFNPRAAALVRSLAEILHAGLLLFVDYGYGEREYYLPERCEGTLMCHYQHRAHADPFVYPGLQDITSFVDFSAVAEAGVEGGLELMGYTTQAQFLLGSGIDVLLEKFADGASTLRESQAVQRLTLPGEMGDRFKVIGLSRGLDKVVSGFALKDLSFTL